MRTRKLAIILLATLIALPIGSVSAKSKWTSWWKPNEWLGKDQRSTTVTGIVDSVADKNIMFKTLDGQLLQLIGDNAAKVGENRSVKIRVFGNVIKQNTKYPTGALQVRNFRVLESASVAEPAPAVEPEPVPEPISEPEPYVEPEPIAEPEPVAEPETAVQPEPYPEPSPMAVPADVVSTPEPEPAPVAEPEYTEYVVESGDTLGKISKKMFGTTAKWKRIAEYNSITDPRLLRVGNTIRIPKK